MAWIAEWKNPPASAFKSERELLEDDLRACPGRWARVQRAMKSKTAYSSWRKQGFEAVTAPAETNPELWDVYARAPGEWKDADATASPSAAPAKSPAGPAPKPLVAQKVTRARPEAQGTHGRPSSGSAEDLTPEKVAAQLKARRDALRSGSRG